MSLVEKEYLYRIRIVFNSDGVLELVETVDRSVVVKGGEVLPGATETVTVYPAHTLGWAVEALLKAMHYAKAEDDALKVKTTADA